MAKKEPFEGTPSDDADDKKKAKKEGKSKAAFEKSSIDFDSKDPRAPGFAKGGVTTISRKKFGRNLARVKNQG